MRIAVIYPKFATPDHESEVVGHPAHRGFAETIDANSVTYTYDSVGVFHGTIVKDFISGIGADIDEYDVYLIENATALYVAPRIKRQAPDSKIVFLAADFRIAGTDAQAFSADGIKPYLKYINSFLDKKCLDTIINRWVDGVIAVSNLVKERIKRSCPSVPTRVAHPYVNPSLFSELSEIEPEVDGKTVITVCANRDHKGVDNLVQAWKLFTEMNQYSDHELLIVGQNHPESYGRVEGINVLGYVDDLVSTLERASLYVQPARFDAFPVSVLEAMVGGLPPLVTTRTGSRSEVEQISGSLVVEPTPSALAGGLDWYFSLDSTEQKKLSEAARNRGRNFDQDSRKERFQDEFDELLAQISQFERHTPSNL